MPFLRSRTRAGTTKTTTKATGPNGLCPLPSSYCKTASALQKRSNGLEHLAAYLPFRDGDLHTQPPEKIIRPLLARRGIAHEIRDNLKIRSPDSIVAKKIEQQFKELGEQVGALVFDISGATVAALERFSKVDLPLDRIKTSVEQGHAESDELTLDKGDSPAVIEANQDAVASQLGSSLTNASTRSLTGCGYPTRESPILLSWEPCDFQATGMDMISPLTRLQMTAMAMIKGQLHSQKHDHTDNGIATTQRKYRENPISEKPTSLPAPNERSDTDCEDEEDPFLYLAKKNMPESRRRRQTRFLVNRAVHDHPSITAAKERIIQYHRSCAADQPDQSLEMVQAVASNVVSDIDGLFKDIELVTRYEAEMSSGHRGWWMGWRVIEELRLEGVTGSFVST